MLCPPKPSPRVICKYLKQWEKKKKYREQEDSLDLLFKQFPLNHDLKKVLFKTSVLNDFYRTNLPDRYLMAKHIVEIKNVDQRLQDGDATLIDDIADTQFKKGKKRREFSFATKYCSRHFPKLFPVYDSNVRKMLLHYCSVNKKFSQFTDDQLRMGNAFKKIITWFITFYKLRDFSYRQVDRFLWLGGKKFFPQ